MRWASAISRAESFPDAIAEAGAAVARDLEGEKPDLVVAFVSPHFSGRFDDVPRLVRERFGDVTLIGCSGGGIIGDGSEVEHAPALSLTAAHLPGASITPFSLDEPNPPDLPDDARSVVLLADPFTFDASTLISSLDTRSLKTIGGLASGGVGPGTNALFCDERTLRAGAVGVALGGDIEVDTIIAQGCRPIGEPMLVTKCQENLILELNQTSPIEVLRDLVESADERDRDLFRHSLFVGVEMRDEQVEKKAGDYLIRNIVGLDPDAGAIAVAAEIHQWQAVQFHLRDARTSAEDLGAMLEGYRSTNDPTEVRGALLFSCLGRGVGLYQEPNHDSSLFRARIGDVPVGGFFCNGEIGPVGGTTFLHGYTSAFGIFRSSRPKPR